MGAQASQDKGVGAGGGAGERAPGGSSTLQVALASAQGPVSCHSRVQGLGGGALPR